MIRNKFLKQFADDISGLICLNDLSFLKDKLAEEAGEYINGWMKSDEENMTEEIFDLFVVTLQIWNMWGSIKQIDVYNKWRKKHWEVISDGLKIMDELQRGLTAMESVHSEPEPGSADTIGKGDKKDVLSQKGRGVADSSDDGASE